MACTKAKTRATSRDGGDAGFAWKRAAAPSNPAARSSSAPGPDPELGDQQTLYALGADLGSNVEIFSLTPAELAVVEKGFDDAANERPLKVDVDKLRPDVSRLAMVRKIARTQAERRRGQEYLRSALKEPNARQLPSGVVISTLRAGRGSSPGPTDRVTMNYEGRLIDGTVVDSSSRTGGPAEFHLQSVARCWTDALQTMKTGEQARLICPSNLAYGESGNPPLIPGGATLVFDIELLGITPALKSTVVNPAAALPAASTK